MKILVIAEHDNKKIKPSTLSTISAGLKIDDNILATGRVSLKENLDNSC